MALDFYEEVPNIRGMNSRKIQKTFLELQNYPEKGQILILCENQKVVGYAILIFFWSNEFGGNFINIDELYLKPESRNQGLGTSFFEVLKKYKIKDKVGFQLEVNPKNKKAIKIYKKLGFLKHENIILDLLTS